METQGSTVAILEGETTSQEQGAVGLREAKWTRGPGYREEGAPIQFRRAGDRGKDGACGPK